MTASRQPMRTSVTSGDSRGQSNPIGMILVLGLVIAGASAIVVLGASAMEDTQTSLSEQRAEKVMTQLDSKSALVALGNTGTQRVALPRSGAERFGIRSGTAWMNISAKNQTSGDVTTILNKTLGEVRYESEDGTTIAYQGGGVWRAEPQGASIMISPPEFHYRGATLTLPIVTVDGDRSLTRRARISGLQETQYFPNKSIDPDFVNPLQRGQVNVTVKSEYYEGWGNYFETRTGGTVAYDHDNRTVTAELRVPFDETFDWVVSTTQSDGITVNGADPKPEPYKEGATYPSVDTRIEDQVDDCVSGSCTAWTSTITSSGTYYTDQASDVEDWTVDDPDGNVTVVANTDLTGKDIRIENLDDDHIVTVLARHNVDINDDFNVVEGDPSDLQVLVHSDGDVDSQGSGAFRGVLYAPESHCDLNGGGGADPNIKGSILCETMKINGNPNDFEYDDSVSGRHLGINPDQQAYITYLHITTNDVTIRSG